MDEPVDVDVDDHVDLAEIEADAAEPEVAPIDEAADADADATPMWEGASKYAEGKSVDDCPCRYLGHARGEPDEDAEPEPEPVVVREPHVPLEDEAAELDQIISKRLVAMVYQPITSLLDDSVVGYEALARGPETSPLATPAAMFSRAEVEGRTKDLDLVCQGQAVEQARDVLLKSGHALFVNVEPGVLADAAFGRDQEALDSFTALLENMQTACPLVLEISDRYPYESSAELLGIVMWARSYGFRIALDDVNVKPRSLALLPLLEPDVIKLDRHVLTAKPNANLGLLAQRCSFASRAHRCRGCGPRH